MNILLLRKNILRYLVFEHLSIIHDSCHVEMTILPRSFGLQWFTHSQQDHAIRVENKHTDNRLRFVKSLTIHSINQKIYISCCICKRLPEQTED